MRQPSPPGTPPGLACPPGPRLVDGAWAAAAAVLAHLLVLGALARPPELGRAPQAGPAQGDPGLAATRPGAPKAAGDAAPAAAGLRPLEVRAWPAGPPAAANVGGDVGVNAGVSAGVNLGAGAGAGAARQAGAGLASARVPTPVPPVLPAPPGVAPRSAVAPPTASAPPAATAAATAPPPLALATAAAPLTPEPPPAPAGPGAAAPGAAPGAMGLAKGVAPAATAPSAAPVAPAADDDQQPPPVYATRLPPPFRLAYALRRGALSGQAELTLQRLASGYELDLKGTVLGLEVLGLSSRGGVGPQGFMPERFVDRRRGKDRLAANFDHGAGRITYSGSAAAQPLLPGAQDRLSWMVQLAAILEAAPARYPVGSRIALSVSGARGDVDIWTFVVQGRQRLTLAAGGATEALRLTREPRRPYDTQVEAWLDPAQHHLPVRARLTVLPGGETLELSLAAG